MAYFHGARASEVPTSIVTPVNTTAGLPVVFGTAPVHLTDDPAAHVNKPVICYSWDEAVKALGYSGDWDKYTLCEVMYSEFKLYAVAPIVFVNVLDPAKHKKSVTNEEHALAAKIDGNGKEAVVGKPVLLSTLTVKATAESEAALTEGTDYTAAYDDDGRLIVTALATGALKSATSVYLTYDEVDPSAVTANDVIGGDRKSVV